MRKLRLLLGAAIAVWIALFLDVRSAVRLSEADTTATSEKGPRVLSEGSREAAMPTEAQQPAAPARGAQTARTEPWTKRLLGKVSAAISPAPRPARAAQDSKPAATGSPNGVDSEIILGELGEGQLSPEFRDVQERYAHEGRDETWAAQTESKIRALFIDPELASKLALLNCQARTCRLVLEDSSQEQVAALLYLPGLRKATGIGPESPYSLRAGQLSVYFEPESDAAEGSGPAQLRGR